MGCFWCTEAVFQRLQGVQKLESGFSGGHVPNPSYRAVCAGTTGHAEVAHIMYDADIIRFEELLEVFWVSHDPTTLNRQGNDVGTMYRSAIFYHSEEQRQLAEASIKGLTEAGVFKHAIVTEVAAFEAFYPAEDHHQNYFNNNTQQGYCQFIIQPKVDKIKKAFREKLKTT